MVFLSFDKTISVNGFMVRLAPSIVAGSNHLLGTSVDDVEVESSTLFASVLSVTCSGFTESSRHAVR